MLQELRSPGHLTRTPGGEEGVDEVSGAAPIAEVWMGSHPRGTSILEESGTPLSRYLHDDPERRLGSRAATLAPPGDDQPGLPFLFKILTAEKGLSIQSHPTRERAASGYAAEERAGVPLDAPHRNYRDRNHKPELILALGDFWGLRGFRPLDELAREMAAFAASLVEPELAGVRRTLEEFVAAPGEEGWRRAFAALVVPGENSSDGALSAALSGAVDRYAAAPGMASPGDSAPEEDRVARDDRYWWCRELARQFPGDIGAAAPLYLNLFHLQPGEAVFLAPGVLHAYLYGAGVEIMANSDNVLRAGCTGKHVDVPELLASLSFAADPATVIAPAAQPIGGGGWLRRFETPAAEFELLEVGGGEAVVELEKREGPAVILAIAGGCRVAADSSSRKVQLGPTESAFVDHATTRLRVDLDRDARVYVASLPGTVSARERPAG